MRIITWNVRHGGGKRAKPFTEKLLRFKPDIVVITEFRNNAAGDTIRGALSEAGLDEQRTGDAPPRVNSVLVAANRPFDTHPVPNLGEHAHRVIHAHIDDLQILGAYFPGKHAKASVFEAVCNLPPEVLQDRALFIGDLNTGRPRLDEVGSTFFCSEYFDRLEDLGWIDAWRSRNPDTREYTWFSNTGNGFRLDHAFASQSFDEDIQSIRYCHEVREQELSDHSALVLDIAP